MHTTLHAVADFENKNLEDIVTPVNAIKLKQLLDEAGYDNTKTQYLYEGFT